MPSSLISPAALTERPERSSAAAPSRRKPLVPIRLPRLIVAGKFCALASPQDAPPSSKAEITSANWRR